VSDYIPQANYRRKDDLPTGQADKQITGAELQIEFNAIATAIATKANTTDIPAGNPITTTSPATFTAGYGVAPSTLTPGSTVTPVATVSNFFTLTYTQAAVTIAAPTGALNGQRIFIKFINNVVGGVSTFTWNTVFKFRGSDTRQPTQTQNAIDLVEAVYDGSIWLTRYIGKNYA
jgi:hypothetical protein